MIERLVDRIPVLLLLLPVALVLQLVLGQGEGPRLLLSLAPLGLLLLAYLQAGRRGRRRGR